MKTLPISFYVVRLSASVWFRKKLCGKVNVVFNVNVMRRFTIASNVMPAKRSAFLQWLFKYKIIFIKLPTISRKALRHFF